MHHIRTLGPTLALALLAATSCVNSMEDPFIEQDVDAVVNPTADGALSMPTCGTALAEFDGTVARSNGGNTGTGISCAGQGGVAGGLQYQCVELVMRHFKVKWGLRWYGNAKDLLNNAPRSTVDVFQNGDAAHPPVPGDMIVWKNGTYGHVALVTAVRSDGIDIIEQNVSGNGKATLPYNGATVGARWGSWTPAGWAHAKANTVTTPTDPGHTDPGQTDPAPTDPAPTDPGTGGGWDCADSAYRSAQYWTCASDGDAHRCTGTTPELKDCSKGCYGAGVGKNDLCIEPDSAWSCSSSAYRNAQYWTCSGGDIHRCENGQPVKVDCPAGCNVMAVGTNDTCK